MTEIVPIHNNRENDDSGSHIMMCSMGSQNSFLSSSSQSLEIFCRICHGEGDAESGLITPCYCSGSLRYVHQSCIERWIRSANIKCCELCRFQFIMQAEMKPFKEWEPLQMSRSERRKMLCAFTFYGVAVMCLIWSIYLLINRTAEEIYYGVVEWQFWTRLIVDFIGFTGSVIFLYLQCKPYMAVCKKWKAFNRVILVQNAPEKLVQPGASSIEVV